MKSNQVSKIFDYMAPRIKSRIYHGWLVLIGCSLVVFGASGSQFSFGVFLKPMAEEFGWSRSMLATAFGITFMLTGLLRPIAGYLADRYGPKMVSLSGIVLMAAMILLLPYIQTLTHLFLIFSAMSFGLTLSAGSTLTKVVSSWFYRRRGVTLGLLSAGGSIGGLVLVPSSSLFLVMAGWEQAYQFLGILLLLVILPAGYLLIVNRPQDIGVVVEGYDTSTTSKGVGDPGTHNNLEFADSDFSQAIRTAFFWKLTLGYFV